MRYVYDPESKISLWSCNQKLGEEEPKHIFSKVASTSGLYGGTNASPLRETL